MDNSNIRTGGEMAVNMSPTEQVAKKTEENVAKQVEQSKFENTELKASAPENNAEKIESETDQELEKPEAEEHSEKTEKKEKKEEYGAGLFRKDPIGFAKQFSGQNKQYKLPENILQNLMKKLMDSILSGDKRTLKKEKANIPTPSSILDDVIAEAVKNGVDDPAQIDKIFEFLEQTIDVKEEPQTPQEASNVKKLKENISKARSEYREKTPGIEKRHIAWNVRDPLQDELKNAGIDLSDKEATDLTVNLIQSSETPVTQTVKEFHEKMKLSYDQIDELCKKKTLPEMGKRVKDTSKEAPELLAIIRTIKNLLAFSGCYGTFKEMHHRAVDEFGRSEHIGVMKNIEDEESA